MNPVISVIIPVRNEADTAAQSITRLRKSAELLPTEIIVVDGGSTDSTCHVVRPLADSLLVSPKQGRAVQMHLGAENARGEILVFLHADTRLPDKWQEIVRETFFKSGQPPAAAAFQICFDAA